MLCRHLMESQLQASNPVGILSVLQPNRILITFAITIEANKSHNLIGTVGSSEFGPK